jgi:tetratricopeptide (TPR) repeat protein
MSMMSDPKTSEFLTYVDVYVTKKYFSHLERRASSLINSPGIGPIAMFWHAFALHQLQQYTEAIAELNELTENKQIQFAAYCALTFVQKAAHIRDKALLTQTKQQYKALSQTADHDSLVFAARYLWHMDKLKLANQCVSKVIKDNDSHAGARSLAGWFNPRESKYFDASLEIQDGNLHALMGRALHRQARRQFIEALNDLNRITISFPRFDVAFAEKAKTQMLLQLWQEAFTTANTALTVDPDSIDALLTIIVYHLASKSDTEQALAKVFDLIRAIGRSGACILRLF